MKKYQWAVFVVFLGFIVPFLFMTTIPIGLEQVFGAGFLFISLFAAVYLARIKLEKAQVPPALKVNLFEMGLLAGALFVTGILLLSGKFR